MSNDTPSTDNTSPDFHQESGSNRAVSNRALEEQLTEIPGFSALF
jgi:hypothetical protein